MLWLKEFNKLLLNKRKKLRTRIKLSFTLKRLNLSILIRRQLPKYKNKTNQEDGVIRGLPLKINQKKIKLI